MNKTSPTRYAGGFDRCLRRDHPRRRPRPHDPDPLIAFHIEQVLVPRDDQLSVSGECGGDHMIVVRIVGHDTRHGPCLITNPKA